MTEPEANDALRPVAVPEHLETAAPSTRRDGFSRFVFVMSLLLALAALAASAFAFIGFAENDTGAGHLLSAFALCFGTGALAYAPLILTSVYAKKAVSIPMPPYRSIIIILLLLPWLPFALYLIKGGAMTPLWPAIMIGAALLIIVWAARFLRA